MKYLKLILYSIFFMFTSCAFVQSTVSKEIVLPASYKGRDVDYWFVFYSGGSAETENTRGQTLAGGESVNILFPVNTVSAVVAYPVINGKKERPAGLIFPYSNTLKEEEGYAAYILYRLYTQNESPDKDGVREFLSCFNWPHFVEVCEDFNETKGDIWETDTDAVVCAIANASFKKSILKKKHF